MTPVVEIYKVFRFEAAHYLPNVPEGHKCGRMHGHSFEVQLTLAGEPDATLGWLVDFGDVKEAWKPLDEVLDHHLLNNVPGLYNPTSENLARWIWEKLEDDLPQLTAVRVAETCTCGAVYRG